MEFSKKGYFCENNFESISGFKRISRNTIWKFRSIIDLGLVIGNHFSGNDHDKYTSHSESCVALLPVINTMKENFPPLASMMT